jgi:hypothetical protein
MGARPIWSGRVKSFQPFHQFMPMAATLRILANQPGKRLSGLGDVH